MLEKVCRSLQTQSAAPSINIVTRKDGIDRTDIDIVGGTGLDGVFKQCLQSEDDILHTLDILDTVDELVHRTLALGEFHLSELIPEGIIAHLGIGLSHLRGYASVHIPAEFLRLSRN